MSAIAGQWRRDGTPGADGACATILQAQALYGPHAVDQWEGREIALGRRLFRLTPEDRFDRQPVVGASGAVLVADIRLDNRSALTSALGLDPARSAEAADSALLLAAWEAWGEACVDRLVGPYAFAVWAPQTRRLSLARDPIGERPLFWRADGGAFAFASMPAGLIAIAPEPPAVDVERLRTFLAITSDEGAASFHQGIQRVAPGELMTVTPDAVTARTFWPRPAAATPGMGFDDWATAARERLDQAVEAQLRGAKDLVGAHLSSGWDSAAVTATAARLMAARGGRVAAFTATPAPGREAGGRAGNHGDEAPLASIQAAMNGNIDHVRLVSDGRSPFDDLDADAALAGAPVRNPCNQVWLNAINRAARARGVTVMLTGDFGNHALTYSGRAGLADLIAHGRWGAWLTHARALTASGAMRWAGAARISVEPLLPGPLARLARRALGEWVGREGRHSGLRPAQWAAATPWRGEGLRDEAARRRAAIQRFDPGPYLKAALARWGVDLRQPLADLRLVELCLAAPWETFVEGGRPRALARRVLEDRVAPEILDNPTNGYQAADWPVGLTAARAELAEELARLEHCPPAADLLDLPRLRRLVADWPIGDWGGDEVLFDYRLALQRGVAAGRFARRITGQNQ